MNTICEYDILLHQAIITIKTLRTTFNPDAGFTTMRAIILKYVSMHKSRVVPDGWMDRATDGWMTKHGERSAIRVRKIEPVQRLQAQDKSSALHRREMSPRTRRARLLALILSRAARANPPPVGAAVLIGAKAKSAARARQLSSVRRGAQAELGRAGRTRNRFATGRYGLTQLHQYPCSCFLPH